MTRSVALLARIGWRPREVREGLLIFNINVCASRRLTRLLINKLADSGVVIWPTGNDFGRPCMWVEFDPASQDGLLYLVINDEVLPDKS